MAKRKSFREEIERLDAIVHSLEDPDVDLDEALALFQEGVDRLKSARSILEKTELTVEKVVRAADAELGDDDLDE